MRDDFDVAKTLRKAREIAARPRVEREVPNFPCVVRPSLREADPRHVSLVFHDGHPVFVFPRGTCPEGTP